MAEKLIVIGGTAAGLSAASRARKEKPDMEIQVFEKSGFVSYGACGLPYFVGGLIHDINELVAINAESLKSRRNISAWIHHEVLLIDPEKKEVTVKNLDTDQVSIHSYDKLVIATGAVPVVPPIPGIHSDGVYYLRNMEDGIRLKRAIQREEKQPEPKYAEMCRRYLADCGLPKERTYVTGSPMAEVLNNNLAEIEASDIHERLKLEKGRYILLSAHREENIDTEKNFTSLFTAINRMAEKYDMPVLYSCHPRSRKRLEASGFALDPRVIRHEPLGFHDYNCLQMNAFCVVSDSGTLPEESSFFTSIGHPFPAVCIRTSTERPEALDKACFILAGIDEKSLLQAVDTAVTMNQNGDHGIPVPDYVEENVSAKVVKIIQSYTGVVDKMVWRKF